MKKYAVIFALALPFSPPARAAFIPQKIVAGVQQTCVLSTEGAIKCWGDNRFRNLGTGDNYNYGFYPSSMGVRLPTIDLGTGLRASDICAGFYNVCAIVGDGKVKCWGLNTAGNLGQGTDANVAIDMGDKLPFTDLGQGFHAKTISCGYGHVCAVTDQGQAKCWGNNANGELGIGDTRSRGTKATDMGDHLPYVAPGATILSISSGIDFTCAQFTDGLRCWGLSGHGELGQENGTQLGDTPATTGTQIPPIKLDTAPSGILNVSAGYGNTCALVAGPAGGLKQVKCWGVNYDGELGTGDTIWYGTTANTMGKNLPPVNTGLDDIVDVKTYYHFSCALSRNGRVKCWGANQNGALGLGDVQSRGNAPGQMGDNLPDVDLGLPAKRLSVGASQHACAILVNNAVKCWGLGTSGTLGNESDENLGERPGQMGDALPYVQIGQ